MKKIDDRKLYFYFSIVTSAIALILGMIAMYSISLIEPEIRGYLSSIENINENYRKAYIMLRDPQVFARYENFDGESQRIKEFIRIYDEKVYKEEEFVGKDEMYLGILLERRILGSRLTRNTSVFFLLLSLLGWGLYAFERRINE